MHDDTHAHGHGWSRRRVLKTLFCSSAALALNLDPRTLRAADVAAAAADAQHWLALGDFGLLATPQKSVAAAMADYVRRLGIKPAGLLLLGDNFYGSMKDGVNSDRWQKGFEQMYPADVFPGPCPAILGNHDYTDSGEVAQLAYARHNPATRWTMPARWHRFDSSGDKPLVSFLCIDTNLPGITPGKQGPDEKSIPRLSDKDVADQWDWLNAQLKGRRSPWTIVVGHHPVYSNGAHGDTRTLVKHLAPILKKHKAPMYLCGHDHDLQHLELSDNPTSFVISGGGGAITRPLTNRERGPFAKPVYGFTHMQLNPDRLILRHLDIQGRQIHAFEKHPDGRVIVEAQ